MNEVARFTANFQKYITNNKLTNVQLQQISKKCGISLNSPVKKENIIRDIHSCVVDSYNSRQALIERKVGSDRPLQVFSIDTGLRNFSFCRFEIDSGNFDSLDRLSGGRGNKSKKVGKNPSNGVVGIPRILQWFKMDLNMWAGNPNTDFTPLNYSSLINRVVFELIYNEKITPPDVVLIERQRFRTMGNHNVFEHILKSNILENMLVSSLNTANAIKPNVYAAQVKSVSPQVMSSFWSNYIHENELDGWFKPSVLDDKNTKDLRIELVDNWMTQLISPEMSPQFPYEVAFGDHLDLHIQLDQAQQNILNAKSLGKRQSNSSSRRLYSMMNYLNSLNHRDLRIDIRNDENLNKVDTAKGDDLADSLLHGLSWWKFEQNRVRFFNHIINYSREEREVEKTRKFNIDLLLRSEMDAQQMGSLRI